MTVEVEWARMTGPELRELGSRPKSLAIFPVGSLEQHGPHLPVITDAASAHAAAVRAARLVATEIPVAVLPGFWLGISEHHFPFGGTISLDFQTYQSIFGCVVRSLKVLGFSRLLVVYGHGGNVDPLAVVVRELAVKHAMPIVTTTPWYLAAARNDSDLRFEPRRKACVRGGSLNNVGNIRRYSASGQVR